MYLIELQPKLPNGITIITFTVNFNIFDQANYEHILFGGDSQTDTGKPLNHIILLVKYYVFMEKCKDDKRTFDFCWITLLKFQKHKLSLLCSKIKAVLNINPALEMVLANLKGESSNYAHKKLEL